MRRPRHPRDRDEVGALLRLGDPAHGDPGPDGADPARMRRAILAGAREDHGRIAAMGSRVVVAAALVAAVSDLPPAPPADAVDPQTPRATTVRFTTPRGTQIIWTLDPRVEL